MPVLLCTPHTYRCMEAVLGKSSKPQPGVASGLRFWRHCCFRLGVSYAHTYTQAVLEKSSKPQPGVASGSRFWRHCYFRLGVSYAHTYTQAVLEKSSKPQPGVASGSRFWRHCCFRLCVSFGVLCIIFLRVWVPQSVNDALNRRCVHTVSRNQAAVQL